MWPKKLWGWGVHPSGPAATNLSIIWHRRSRSASRFRSSRMTRSGEVGELRRNGSSFRSTMGFKTRPRKRWTPPARDGIFSPTAHSRLNTQCAMACAAVMVPQSRWLPGCNCARRALNSSAQPASNRLFIRWCSPMAVLDAMIAVRRWSVGGAGARRRPLCVIVDGFLYEEIGIEGFCGSCAVDGRKGNCQKWELVPK
jgi:hypothetical protein